MDNPFKEAFLEALKDAAHSISEGLPSVQEVLNTAASTAANYSATISIPDLTVHLSGPVTVSIQPKPKEV